MKWRCTGCGDEFDAAPPSPDGLVQVPPCGHRMEWEPVYPWDGEGPVSVESIRAAMERIPQAPVVVVHDLNPTLQVRLGARQPGQAMDLASWRPPSRQPGESAIDAAQRTLATGETIPWRTAPSYRYGRDSASFDSRPEHCWRCDAKTAETDVGLCSPCHEDLRAS
jgi:hypothetical protein